MQNLYWKVDGETKNLVEEPFQSEMELEKYIYSNQDLLGDIYIIYRQVKTGSKQGIPDMIGVDQDSAICIIELKNLTADESILPQALSYAIWAETNPDSIKAIWLESKNKPENITVDWDNLDIRLILVAPSFKNTVSRMAVKIGYPIDLIQIRRYCFEDNEFLSVELLEEPISHRIVTTKGVTTWDWEFYESEHGKEATDQFREAVKKLSEFVNRKGWNLPYNINKYYVGFKYANKVLFSVNWGGTYAWKINIKIPEEKIKGFAGEFWEFQSYSNEFHLAVIRPLDPDNPNINELEHFLSEAYDRIIGG